MKDQHMFAPRLRAEEQHGKLLQLREQTRALPLAHHHTHTTWGETLLLPEEGHQTTGAGNRWKIVGLMMSTQIRTTMAIQYGQMLTRAIHRKCSLKHDE